VFAEELIVLPAFISGFGYRLVGIHFNLDTDGYIRNVSIFASSSDALFVSAQWGTTSNRIVEFYIMVPSSMTDSEVVSMLEGARGVGIFDYSRNLSAMVGVNGLRYMLYNYNSCAGYRVPFTMYPCIINDSFSFSYCQNSDGTTDSYTSSDYTVSVSSCVLSAVMSYPRNSYKLSYDSSYTCFSYIFWRSDWDYNASYLDAVVDMVPYLWGVCRKGDWGGGQRGVGVYIRRLQQSVIRVPRERGGYEKH